MVDVAVSGADPSTGGFEPLVLRLDRIARHRSAEHHLPEVLAAEAVLQLPPEDDRPLPELEAGHTARWIDERRLDLFRKLRGDPLVTVQPHDPVAGGLLKTKVDVSEDVVLTLHHSALRVLLTDRRGVIDAEHVDHDDLVGPGDAGEAVRHQVPRVQGGNDDGKPDRHVS